MAGLGGKGLRKRDGQIGQVNSFPLRGFPLTSSNRLAFTEENNKGAGLGQSRRERVKQQHPGAGLNMTGHICYFDDE